MNSLNQQVNCALRRLMIQRFLGLLTWTCFAALLVVLGVAIVDRIWGFWQLQELQLGYLVGGAFGVGFISAAIWSYVTRPDTLEAAIELDKRYHLKERVSSALNLPATEFDSPAGKALIEDAERRIQKVEVSEHFGLKLQSTALLPVVPALVAFLVILLVPMVKVKTADASTSTNGKSEVVKPNANIKPLIKSVKKKREEAKAAGLKDAERLFEKLEQGTREISPKEDQKKTLVKLNNLADELKKRANQLGNSEKLKQQLNNLKDMEKGPADKFGKALKNGDLKQGLDELKKLQDKLANNELDAQAKEDLQKQMEAMKDQLQQMVDQHEQLKKDLEKKAEELRKEGKFDQADQVDQQLDRLNQQNNQMKQLQKLANQMQQCKECMKNGQMQDAAQQLAEAQQNLQEMMQNEAEMEMLKEAMQEIQDMKCEMCQGEGKGQGQKMQQQMQQMMAQGQGQGDGKQPGNGLGRGPGGAMRPEQEEKTNTRDSKAKTHVGKGSAVIVGEGPNAAVKGQIAEEIRTQVEATKKGESDALTDQVLPKQYRDHAREYFDKFRPEDK